MAADRATGGTDEREVTRIVSASIGVALTVTMREGARVGLLPGALRCLLAFEAATDAGGRFTLARGAGALYNKATYYKHVLELEAGGYVRRLAYRRGARRHAELTAKGRATAARVSRQIERAAREYLAGSAYVE